MALKKVKLNEVETANGTIQQLVGVDEDGNEVFIPADEPTNRYFVEAKEWYKAQKNKPFKYKFE